MPKPKRTKATSTEEFGDSGFKFCCGNSEEISQMMRRFCGGEDVTVDCGKMMQMMQKMCGQTPVKPDK